MFFSILTLPEEYEKQLKDEIWGCFKYIGIPIETIYNMPIQDRRYFIYKHNAEQEGSKDNKKEGTYTYQGDLNNYAKMEQDKNNKKY